MFKKCFCVYLLVLSFMLAGCVPSKSGLMEEVVKQRGQIAKEKVRADAQKEVAKTRAEAEIAIDVNLAIFFR